ncbi:unnamed protein product, partial [Rotaria sp. Silwood1]
ISSFIPINRFRLIRTKWKEMNLEEARHKRLIEIQTWNIIREILILVLFLVCLYSITYANRDIENSHVMLKTKFVLRLHAQKWYNERIPKYLSGYLNDKSNRMIGWASIRQLRVKQKISVEKKSLS